MLQNVSNLLKNVNDKKLKTVFAKSKPVIALKQPKNLLSTLTKAKFETHHIRPQPRNPGISLCSNKDANFANSISSLSRHSQPQITALGKANPALLARVKMWFTSSHAICATTR